MKDLHNIVMNRTLIEAPRNERTGNSARVYRDDESGGYEVEFFNRGDVRVPHVYSTSDEDRALSMARGFVRYTI